MRGRLKVESIIGKGKDKRKIFFKNKETTPILEAFRVFRTNMYFIDRERRNKVVLFTSSLPGEGKSTVATNYAVTEAMAGKKVLVIDCDVRKPTLHKFFGVKNELGLHSILAEERHEGAVKKVSSNLDIIPTENMSRNQTEMLQSDKLSEFLTMIKTAYDIIILDAPPVNAVADPIILSKESDGVVVVCGYDMVNKRQLEYTKKQLNRAGANIYGVVINRIDQSGYGHGSHGYYNDHYGYYDYHIKSSK